MARVNKATRRQRGFRQLGLRGTFEKTTSYTLCPARSQLSVLQDGDTLEKKLGRGGGGAREKPEPQVQLAHLARAQPQRLLPSELSAREGRPGLLKRDPVRFQPLP